ncbi:anaerobic glycerol-3-phosphate dehydrogenase subunit A [Klebsiella pneumoniae]|uniref:Anaerobic glycerol-3-phosphate dehydrogenase subunit A n=1 Tax=Klebsiella pneumoniae TaxID=573 RepID=A0A2X3ECI7_KLEPN|nr:anaerobic glycerol-3-phosphate dehydrogenase subunit A [Klebsiella pneumoniae]
MASDNDPSGRGVSRGIVLLDHAQRDGMEGFITITGGKLMTYRLMAEWATDAVCRKLGNTTPCTTAEAPLPGSQEPTESTLQKIISLPHPAARLGRLPSRRSHPVLAWRQPPAP